MSSRYGPRPVGTDGTDFKHRERVAQQYNQSPLFKRRIRTVLYLQVSVWLLIVAKLLPELCIRFGFVSKNFMRKWSLPPADLWEYAWAAGSIFPVIFSYLSLPKNKVSLMRISLLGHVTFGIVPIAVGCFQKSFELINFYYTRLSTYNFFGFPFIVLVYIFFSVCVQLHFFTLFFGYKLLGMWSRVSTKNK
uniref:Protein jagunal homolog 1 n=2 Tax=Schistocephalus solidus TaxID=70667 RepID=A0A0X3P821_SCHSO